MSWQNLADDTLTVATSTITNTVDNKKFYNVIVNGLNDGNPQQTLRFNADGSSNYGRRYSANAATDVANTSNRISTGADSSNGGNSLTVGYVINISSLQKVVISYGADTGVLGAAGVPNKYEAVGNWYNATDAISSISIYNPTAATDFNIDSNTTIFGTD
tara:strand:+ start:1064 stop:1543 length:480 start_codon:yes stop_codon:yes gene_type:complete